MIFSYDFITNIQALHVNLTQKWALDNYKKTLTIIKVLSSLRGHDSSTLKTFLSATVLSLKALL